MKILTLAEGWQTLGGWVCMVQELRNRMRRSIMASCNGSSNNHAERSQFMALCPLYNFSFTFALATRIPINWVGMLTVRYTEAHTKATHEKAHTQDTMSSAGEAEVIVQNYSWRPLRGRLEPYISGLEDVTRAERAKILKIYSWFWWKNTLKFVPFPILATSRPPPPHLASFGSNLGGARPSQPSKPSGSHFSRNHCPPPPPHLWGGGA